MNMDEALLSEVRRVLGDRILEGEADDVPTIAVRATDLYETVAALKEDRSLAFGILTDLFGMHYPAEQADPDGRERGEELGVQVLLHNMGMNKRLRITCRFPVESPEVASLTPLFPAANWLERETFDFYGIRFSGHPNLKRILNIETMTVFPMRKDFPLEDQTREDKDDRMFGR